MGKKQPELQMTNLISHAKRELEILNKAIPNAIVIPFTKEILTLCEAFFNSGQSGSSAPYTAIMISQVVKKLMMFETLTPLTGMDDEWCDISHINNNESMYQNNRDSRIFKNGKNGKSYFVEAIVFNGNIGGRFTTGKAIIYGNEKIGSTLYIKGFPFIPKTFYIDVIDHRWKDKEETISDVDGGWWTHSVSKPEQLEEVFEYYDKF